jgi:hypothetical protein
VAFPPLLLPTLLAVPYAHLHIEVLRPALEPKLAALIRMMDGPGRDPAPAQRHLESVEDQPGAEVVGH